jgi:hypothetical protein
MNKRISERHSALLEREGTLNRPVRTPLIQQELKVFRIMAECGLLTAPDSPSMEQNRRLSGLPAGIKALIGFDDALLVTEAESAQLKAISECFAVIETEFLPFASMVATWKEPAKYSTEQIKE